MKINKEKIEAITRLPDEEMWKEIIKTARSYGFNLPQKTPSHAELEKIRSLASGNQINIADAMKIMNDLKRSGKNG